MSNDSEIKYAWPKIEDHGGIFSTDNRFTPRNKAGQSKTELAASSVSDVVRKNSTIYGLSEKSDKLLAMRKSGVSIDPVGGASQLRRQRIAKASI